MAPGGGEKNGAAPYAPAERDGAKDASMCVDETASMPANHPIKSDRPVKSEETGRVLRFEPRRSSNWPRPWSAAPLRPPADLAEPQSRGAEQEEYRHRMRANLAATLLVGLLIGCGFWLFNSLTELRKSEDCVLSGRHDCAPIEVPPSR